MSVGTGLSSAVGIGMRGAVYAVVVAAATLFASQTQAQTTLDVIGPHEYDLPVNFDPFNVFVQYAYVQDNSEFFASNGDQIDGTGSQQIVGLSKYVRFWTPNFNRNIGMAWEIIQPEISVRDHSNPNPDLRHISGFGDTITGFATWFKPTPGSTLGIQSFLQIPWGDQDVSDTNWKNLTSILYYTPLGGGFDWTGNLGFVWQSSKSNGTNPGMLYHANNRWGYRATSWLEPFIGLDWEYQEASNPLPEAWALDGGIGLMFFYYENQSITVRYSTSLDGSNHSYNDSWNLKYVYLW
jgi:hypothetical protein